MKTSRFFSGLKGQLLLTFLLITLIPLLIVSGAAYFLTRSALQTQETNHLISVREIKKSEIETYFDTIRKQAVTMAENGMVVAAMQEFSQDFQQAATVELTESEMSRYEETLRAYYTNEYLSRLNANLDSPAEAGQYLPTEQTRIIWQYYYIADNPNAVGQKDSLTAAEDGSDYSQAHRRYHPAFRNFLKEFGYYDIFLVDPEGNIVYTVFKEADYATNLLTGPYRQTNIAAAFKAANEAGEQGFARLVDFEPYDPSYHAPAAFIAAPIYEGSQKLGVLIFQIPIERIDAIMTNQKNWTGMGLGEQGEVYLIGADSKMRSNSRRLVAENDAQFTTAPLEEPVEKFNTTILLKSIETTGVQAALKGQSGTGLFSSGYRGAAVLSAYAPLDMADVRWAILAETTEAEAFAAANQLAFIILVTTAVVALLVVIISVLRARAIAQPIVEITETAVQVAEGDLGAQVPSTERGDEIGRLAQTFTRMLASFQEMAGAAEQVAAGNLRVQVPCRSERDVLGQALAGMVTNLQTQTQETVQGINILAEAVAEISSTISELAANASETATAVSETSTTMEEVKQTAYLSSKKAQQVAELAQKTSQISQNGRQVTTRSVEGMGRIKEQMETITTSIVNLSERNQAISQIIATVNDLADQSNLLAVNAAIEAAKAGEQGKGFAVVAQEIKNLAEQSKRATAQVQAILNDIQKATTSAVIVTEQGGKTVDSGVQQSLQAGEVIVSLANSVNEAADAATQIAVSSQQQLIGTDQMVVALESIKQASLQNVDGSRQLESAAHDLNTLGQRLKELVERYQV